jgi:hypothetical protein
MSSIADDRSLASPFQFATGWWKSIRGALHPRGTSADHASFYMLRLYRTNLEVRLRSIDRASLQFEGQKQSYDALEKMLAAPPVNGAMATRNLEWDEIYKAESLFTLLLSGEQLRQEIDARLQELAKENPSEADALRKDYDNLAKSAAEGQKPADDAGLRMFLLRVMEMIHWAAKKKYLARPIRKEATNRILAGLLLSFILLIAPYIYLNFEYGSVTDSSTQVGKWWSLFALWTVVTAGLLGAFFSRLMSVQRQWSNMSLDEVFLHRDWPYTLLRAGVGVCGALIVYFFLRSGIVDGALFPNFNDVRIEFVNVPGDAKVEAVHMSFVMPSKALALLTFWCFLAGFSEALVPGILSSTEKQLTDAATVVPGRAAAAGQ